MYYTTMRYRSYVLRIYCQQHAREGSMISRVFWLQDRIHIYTYIPIYVNGKGAAIPGQALRVPGG
jgi:hypothetical protein